MAIAKSKQAQTVVNLLYTKVARPIVEASAVVQKLRQAVVDNDLTGEFTGTELSALESFASEVQLLAASKVVEALAGRFAATHRNKALTITGVNDG